VLERTERVRVCLEASGNYSLDLALALHGHGQVEVSVINPRRARKFAESLGERSKTDPVHARVLSCSTHALGTLAAPEFTRNRLLKVLEGANIKLSSVATDVFGVSGRLMLRALIDGKTSPQEMATLAKGKFRKKIQALEPALEGKLESHHRFLLGLQLKRVQAAEEDLATLEQQIQKRLEPYAAQLALLDEIPGVNRGLAAAMIAELGGDMKVFERVSQLTSWAGVCPGNNESAANARAAVSPKAMFI